LTGEVGLCILSQKIITEEQGMKQEVLLAQNQGTV
jgi:hypothetical protein